MLAEEATRVLAVRARLRTEAWREGHVGQWQLRLVQDLGAVQVGDGHLRRWDQVAVAPVERRRELEQVLLKLWKLAGAVQRISADEVRHLRDLFSEKG